MFYNEIFENTKVLRKPHEPSSKRDWRALCQLGLWYDNHLNHQKKIILLSELPHSEMDTPTQIIRMNTKQYLDLYYPHNLLLQNLVHVLADVVLDEEEEYSNKIKLTSKHAKGHHDAVSGYTEV